MKKRNSAIYWIGVLVSHLLAFSFIATVIVLVLGLPSDSMFSGMAGCGIVVCLLIFGASDETKEFLKKLASKEKEEG